MYTKTGNFAYFCDDNLKPMKRVLLILAAVLPILAGCASVK